MEEKKKVAEDRLDSRRSKIPKPINPFLDSRVSLKFADARRAKRVRFEEPGRLSPLSSKPIACSANAPGILLAKDARKSKRVRFEEPGSLSPLTCKPIPCSRNVPGILSENGNDPKTSEYAFYKKLREDTAHTFHSYQPHEQHEQMEKSEAQNHTKEMTRIVKPIYETRPLSSTEKGTPVALLSSSLPPIVAMNSGSECEYKDIFSIKRQKLLNLAMEASSLDIDVLCSKGYDFVSMLLQRLHPESNAIAETSCSTTRSRTWEPKFNSKSQLHVSRESDIHLEDIPRTPSMSLVSPFSGKNLRNGLLESWSNKPTECYLLPDVGKDLGSLLPWHPEKTLRCERRMPGDLVDCWEPSTFHANKDSRSSVQPNKELLCNRNVYLALDYMPNQSRYLCPAYKNVSLNSMESDNSSCLSSGSSFNELGYLYPTKLVSDSKQFGGFLGCSAMENEQDFLDSSCRAATNISPTWRTSSEDNLQNLNYILDGTEVQSPSNRAICHYSDITLGNISSGSYLINNAGRQTPKDNLQCMNDITDGFGMHSPPTQGIHYYSDITLGNKSTGTYIFNAVGRQTPEVREYQLELPEDLSLSLCCTPKYLALEERCRSRSIVQQTSMFPSPLGNVRYMSKIFGERNSPRLGSRLQSSIGIDNRLYDLASDDHLKEPLSTCSDELGIDIRGASSFLLTRDKTERYTGSFDDAQCHAEDLCRAYDLTSLNFKFPLNKNFCPLLLDAPRRRGSGEISGDCNEDIAGQFLLMDSLL